MTVMGIENALDFANAPVGLARKEFNIDVERTVRELNGQSCKTWDAARADKKQIYFTRSLGERITEFNTLQQALSQHAGIALQKARKQQSLCKVMLFFAASSPFDDKPVRYRAIHHFPYPS
jgi:DNA polymerase V